MHPLILNFISFSLLRNQTESGGTTKAPVSRSVTKQAAGGEQQRGLNHGALTVFLSIHPALDRQKHQGDKVNVTAKETAGNHQHSVTTRSAGRWTEGLLSDSYQEVYYCSMKVDTTRLFLRQKNLTEAWSISAHLSHQWR